MEYHKLEYRVPYADTDQMGVVYYANYLEYFERGRTEMLRFLGMPYSQLEALGIFLPVSEAHCRYRSSAHYDDLLTIASYVKEFRGARLVIGSKVFRDDELLVEGEVSLACINKDRKICKLPPDLVELLRPLLITE